MESSFVIRILQTTSALALAATLASCASHGAGGPPPLTPTEQFAIEVRQSPDELAVIPSAQGLSPQQGSALQALAQRWRDGGGEAMVVRQPYGAGDPRAVEISTRATVETLAGLGVPPALIQVQGYDAGGRPDAPVTVGFVAYQAIGPQCAETWTHVDATFNSRSSGNFGCSTTGNLAAMIANPRDLLTPRAETPADAARRQAQMGLYRNGQSTGVTRTADERTSVSDVARQ